MTAENSLAASILTAVPPAQRRYLQTCIQSASRMGMPLYLVGGAVRDFLLFGELLELDLDMVTEGDALVLAREVADRLDGRLTAHPRFLTAEVVMGDTNLDLVTARSERYETPASLPVVAPADLEVDLARRDYSVNSMAVALWPAGTGELIDPFTGNSDLDRRLLRVLHERSFFDDPTRILRGVRIGARLEFTFTEATEGLARAAIAADAFAPLSSHRLRQEMILLLEDRQVELSLRRLEELGFFVVLGRAVPIGDSDWRMLTAVQELRLRGDCDRLSSKPPRWWLVYLMSLSGSQVDANRSRMAQRLGLDDRLAEVLVEYPRRLRRVQRVLQASDAAPHAISSALEGLHSEDLVLLLASGDARVAARIDRWLNELRDLHLTIDGKNLESAGFVAGPRLGRALQLTLEARLDGAIGAEEELQFAIRQLQKEEE